MTQIQALFCPRILELREN